MNIVLIAERMSLSLGALVTVAISTTLKMTKHFGKEETKLKVKDVIKQLNVEDMDKEILVTESEIILFEAGCNNGACMITEEEPICN